MSDVFSDDGYKVAEPDLDELYLHKVIFNIFDQTEEGQYLLKRLVNDFVMAKVCVPGSEKGFGHFREGQNSLVRIFLNAIEDHKGRLIK